MSVYAQTMSKLLLVCEHESAAWERRWESLHDMSTDVYPPRAGLPQATSEVRPLRMLHTSDVHLGAYTSQPYRDEGHGEQLEPALAAFKHVLELGVKADVEVVAIAGDFFDHVRVKRPYVEVAGELMAAVERPVVILPGNHDPHMPEGIYEKFADAFPSNVHIIASAEGELVLLEDVGVQFWGQAHESYNDFSPASARPAWAHSSEQYIWRVAMAHGYYVGMGESRYSYQIRASEITSMEADYVALGHIDVHEGVGEGGVPAYYPGAPRHSGGATIVDFAADGVTVRHEMHDGAADDPQSPNPMMAARLH